MSRATSPITTTEDESSETSTQIPRGGSSVDSVGGDVFHEIPQKGNALALLVSLTLENGQPLSEEEFTASKLAAFILRVFKINPTDIEIANAYEAIIEFESDVIVTQVAQALHGDAELNGKSVDIRCLVATRVNLEKVSREREAGRKRLLQIEMDKKKLAKETEEKEERLEELLRRFGQEVEKVEQLQKQCSPRKEMSPREHVGELLRPPNLPFFSGAEPVPKDEGSYQQWRFQVKEACTLHTEAAVKSAIVASVRGEAREIIEFKGLTTGLEELLDYIDERLGQTPPTDKLQKDWYDTKQERGEKISSFASRLENKYKKLTRILPTRYNKAELRDRLFYGMTQQLRDSMRYLFEGTDITYEELLSRTKKVEEESYENKGGVRIKSTIVEPSTSSEGELKGLKKEIEALATVVKSATYKGARPKEYTARKDKREQKPKPKENKSPKGKGTQQDDQSNKPTWRPFQCYKCGGWGHSWKKCPSPENLDWRALSGAGATPPTPPRDGPPRENSN